MRKVLLAMTCLIALDAQAQVRGKTALMSAAEYNDIYNVEKLIRQGYAVNATDFNNNTAYCYAYNQKNLKVAKTLEKFGADTNRRCNIRGVRFATSSINAPYYNEKSTSNYSRRQTAKFSSGFWGANKKYVYAGLGVAGIAAAAGGGGGGGGDSSSNVFSRPAPSTDVDPSAFETAEFYGNAASAGLNESLDSEFLAIINAQYAYARGYTGAGELIAVLDSGLDTDHSEFADTLNSDITNSDFQDGDDDPNHDATNSNHGTNVAGVAAASKDNSGMHGVAYGADIIGYRIGAGIVGYTNPALTDDAIADGIAKGARIFNLSYGSDAVDSKNASNAVKNDLEIAYTGFTDVGSDDNINAAPMNALISNITTNDAIIVRAAGNEGYSQPGMQNALPLHYNEFAGHFITSVALNQAGNGIASFSNHCGVAKNYCIAAPGYGVMTTDNGGGYKLQYGTSFSSPITAGAVAVVKDAFGLSADRTLNIIFQTATDMGAAGVDDVYGHGLLNLDLATAPGSELITSASPGSSFSYMPTSVTTSSAFASLQTPSFVIEDELYRTFTIDASLNNKDDKLDLQDREKSFAKEKKIITKNIDNNLRTSFVMSNEQSADAIDSFDHMSIAGNMNGVDVSFGFTNAPGQELETIVRSANLLQDNALANPYMGLAEKGFVASSSYELSDNVMFQTNVLFGDIENSDNKNLGKSTSALAKLIYSFDDSQVSLESGFLNEKSTVLGSKFEGAFALADDTYTYFTGLTAKTALTSKLDLFANAYVGVTKADSTKNSLVTDVSNIVSHAASFGGQYNFTKAKAAGLVLSQPLKAVSGDINYSYLAGGNIDTGYQHKSESQSLAPSATQFDVQAFYKQKFDDANLNLGLLHSINADSIKGENDTSLLVKYRSKF